MKKTNAKELCNKMTSALRSGFEATRMGGIRASQDELRTALEQYMEARKTCINLRAELVKTGSWAQFNDSFRSLIARQKDITKFLRK